MARNTIVRSFDPNFPADYISQKWVNTETKTTWIATGLSVDDWVEDSVPDPSNFNISFGALTNVSGDIDSASDSKKLFVTLTPGDDPQEFKATRLGVSASDLTNFEGTVDGLNNSGEDLMLVKPNNSSNWGVQAVQSGGGGGDIVGGYESPLTHVYGYADKLNPGESLPYTEFSKNHGVHCDVFIDMVLQNFKVIGAGQLLVYIIVANGFAQVQYVTKVGDALRPLIPFVNAGTEGLDPLDWVIEKIANNSYLLGFAGSSYIITVANDGSATAQEVTTDYHFLDYDFVVVTQGNSIWLVSETQILRADPSGGAPTAYFSTTAQIVYAGVWIDEALLAFVVRESGQNDKLYTIDVNSEFDETLVIDDATAPIIYAFSRGREDKAILICSTPSNANLIQIKRREEPFAPLPTIAGHIDLAGGFANSDRVRVKFDGDEYVLYSSRLDLPVLISPDGVRWRPLTIDPSCNRIDLIEKEIFT